jgi:hypothetical protein
MHERRERLRRILEGPLLVIEYTEVQLTGVPLHPGAVLSRVAGCGASNIGPGTLRYGLELRSAFGAYPIDINTATGGPIGFMGQGEPSINLIPSADLTTGAAFSIFCHHI